MQLAVQTVGVIVSAALAFGVTLAIMKVIDMTIGLGDEEKIEEAGYIDRRQPS
jgi:ammonia channel protein AmtB